MLCMNPYPLRVHHFFEFVPDKWKFTMGFQGTSASNMPQMFVSLHLHWFHTAASNKWSSKDWNLCLWSWMFLAQKNKRFVSMESLRSLRSVALLMVNLWYMNMIERNLHCYNQEPQHTWVSRVSALPIPFNLLHASISACVPTRSNRNYRMLQGEKS